MTVHRDVAGDVSDGVFLGCSFPHEVSWIRSRSELSQLIKSFLTTLSYTRYFVDNTILV